MQMQLGTFRFEAALGAAEYRMLQRTRRRRWTRRERHGRAPEMEDLGRDADEIRLSGSVWVRGAADLVTLDALRDAAGLAGDLTAAPLGVYVGGARGVSGEYAGEWVVTELETTDEHLRLDGTPARIDFQITLIEAAA